MDSHLVHMMVQIQDRQKDQLKEPHFVNLDFDATCQVIQQFFLYHFPRQHSELHRVLISVAANSKGWRFSGFLVLGLLCPFIISDQSLCSPPISEPFLHHQPPSVHNSIFFNFFAWHFNALLWTENIFIVLSLISSPISSRLAFF